MVAFPNDGRPRLVLGNTGVPPERHPFVLDAPHVAHHKHIIGVTGVGKSKLLASIYVQLLNQGIACALVDPHGDLATDILGVLLDTGYFAQPRAFDRLWYVDFSNRDAFLPVNILDQPYDPHTVARNLVEVFGRAWSALAGGAAPNFENIMLASVFVLVENQLPLTVLPRLLSDQSYRDHLLTHVSDPQIVAFFHTRFDKWKGSSVLLESTLRRIFLLTFSPTLRYTLGQQHNVLQFRRLMDERVSVLFNLGGLDEATQRFLGCLLTVGYEVAALSRADMPAEQRSHYHLILDEFSMFSAQSEASFERMLSLTRKYGLYLTLAHQTWSQASERLRGALQNTLGLSFKLGRSDAEWAAKRFGTYDPYRIKHAVTDPQQAGRSHPVYFSAQETVAQWTQEFEHLAPREAFVKVGTQTTKIRTLGVPSLAASRDDLQRIIDQYTARLCTPVSQLVAPVDLIAEADTEPAADPPPGAQRDGRRTTRRRERLPADDAEAVP